MMVTKFASSLEFFVVSAVSAIDAGLATLIHSSEITSVCHCSRQDLHLNAHTACNVVEAGLVGREKVGHQIFLDRLLTIANMCS